MNLAEIESNVSDLDEWFDVPLAAIDEAVELIAAETITSFRYDATTREIDLAG